MKGQEFKAHRTVLAARSPVFMAMMQHDTKEKATGIVPIEDIDPSVFTEFLNFLYAGELEDLNSDNALNLYVAADKYEVEELKIICLKYMLQNITVSNFCDIITVSLQYVERKLTDAATEFFVENSLEIVKTRKWQTFLYTNGTVANELFIKYIEQRNKQSG